MRVPEARCVFREEWDAFRRRVDELLQQQLKFQEALFARMSQESQGLTLGEGKEPSSWGTLGLDIAELDWHGGASESARKHVGEEVAASAAEAVDEASLCSGWRQHLATSFACLPGATSEVDRGDPELTQKRTSGRPAAGGADRDASAPSPRRGAKSVEDLLEALVAAVKEVDAKLSICGADLTQGARPGKSWDSFDTAAPFPRRSALPAEDFNVERYAEGAMLPAASSARARMSIMDNLRGRLNSSSWWRHDLLTPLAAALTWLKHVEPPPPQGRLASAVLSRYFEALLFVVIVSNAGFTWYSLDYEASHLGEKSPPVLDAIEISFVTVYTFELALKISVHRQWFFVNKDMRWNWFDALLVVSSLAPFVMLAFANDAGGTNLTFVRTLRLLKLATLLRGLRVVKFLDELRTMLFSLLGSLLSLVWGIVLLVLIFYVFGLIFVQGAVATLTDKAAGLSDEEREHVSEVFGSVWRAMFSLYRACTGGDDWSNFYHPASTMGASYAALFCFFIAFSQIALLNILTALFLNKAMEIAKPDKDTAGIQQRKLDLAAYEDLCTLGRELDTRRSGFIQVADFKRELRHGNIGARLALLGLNVPDADFFFHLLSAPGQAPGSDARAVSVDDFVEGCMRMRGAASGIDLCSVEKQTRLILRNLGEHQVENSQRLAALTNAVKLLSQPDNCAKVTVAT